MNFAIADAGWTLFASMLHAKAEEAGRTFSRSTAPYKPDLFKLRLGRRCISISKAVFVCTDCGSQIDADVNAAKMILKKTELAACGEGRRVAGPQRSTKFTSAGADPVHAHRLRESACNERSRTSLRGEPTTARPCGRTILLETSETPRRFLSQRLCRSRKTAKNGYRIDRMMSRRSGTTRSHLHIAVRMHMQAVTRPRESGRYDLPCVPPQAG